MTNQNAGRSTPKQLRGHPNNCGEECIHCRLRKVDTAEKLNDRYSHDFFDLQVRHDPAECPKCDKDHAVSR